MVKWCGCLVIFLNSRVISRLLMICCRLVRFVLVMCMCLVLGCVRGWIWCSCWLN